MTIKIMAAKRLLAVDMDPIDKLKAQIKALKAKEKTPANVKKLASLQSKLKEMQQINRHTDRWAPSEDN
jgi:hypothetical protein